MRGGLIKGHIVHFFLTGRERASEREWQFRNEREGEAEGGQRRIGGEEEKNMLWASKPHTLTARGQKITVETSSERQHALT